MSHEGNTPSATEPTSLAADSASDGTPTAIERDLAQPIVVSSDIPPPKRYAHFGKRRRSFTEEMFRCQFVDKISRSDLVCNALLWKNRPAELRQHLLEHLPPEQVVKMSDDEVRQSYTDAKRIFLQGIPEDDEDYEEGESEDV